MITKYAIELEYAIVTPISFNARNIHVEWLLCFVMWKVDREKKNAAHNGRKTILLHFTGKRKEKIATSD